MLPNSVLAAKIYFYSVELMLAVLRRDVACVKRELVELDVDFTLDGEMPFLEIYDLIYDAALLGGEH